MSRQDASSDQTGAVDRNIVALDPGQHSRPDAMTPLDACMLHAAAHLDRPITLAALHAAQSSDGSDRLGVRDVMTAAQRAGVQAAFGARKLRGFDAMLTPAILLLRDEGTGQIARAELEQAYTGYAILLRAEHRDDMAATAMGRQGHWFWSALAANKWSYTQVLMAAVVANFLGLTTSIFIMVYDRILPNEATESLIALTFGVGIALLFDFFIKTLRAGFIDRAGQKADLLMGRRIFDQLLDLQMRARKGSTGALASTLREFETLRDFFTSATLVAVVDLPFILLFVWVIYLIGGPLALVPGLAVPLVLLIGIAVQPVLSRIADKSFADGQSKQSVLVETVSGLETIKATGAAYRMRARWEEAISRQSEHSLQSRAVMQFAMNATGFAQQAAQILIVFYGVFLISDGTVSMGALIASVILTGRALAPLAQLAQTMTRLNHARSSYRSLDALMRSDSERPEGRTWLSRPRLDGAIRLENVHFTYPDQLVATLKGVSFTIQPGEKVAILGRIGSGKSNVARMMLGLYAPDQGAVLVDDTDIRQIDPGDLRRNIGSVLQDVWLFSGTVRENIAIGARHARDTDILDASRIAGVEDFIARHPSGYDLMLAERGEGLSGGQRQAITLARALVGKPPILLLDEPTSAMDVQNERDVIARLKTHMRDQTVVIVTHRTSLLDLVDRVIVIEDGKVAVDGDKSLLSQRAAAHGSGGGHGA